MRSPNRTVVHFVKCDVDILANSYFNSSPPFSGSKNKHEFPDAIALFGLEAWAEKNEKKVLAISSDKSWLNFSEQSQYIDVISDLGEGLHRIQSGTKPSIEEVEGGVQRLVSQINLDKEHPMRDQIDVLLDERVAGHFAGIDYANTYTPIGSAMVGFVRSVEYQKSSLFFKIHRGEVDIKVVSHTLGNINFIAACKITTNVKAVIQHFVEDNPEYREGVMAVEKRGIDILTKLLFSLKGDITQKVRPLSITDISIPETFQIPLGEIEPPSRQDDADDMLDDF